MDKKCIRCSSFLLRDGCVFYCNITNLEIDYEKAKEINNCSLFEKRPDKGGWISDEEFTTVNFIDCKCCEYHETEYEEGFFKPLNEYYSECVRRWCSYDSDVEIDADPDDGDTWECPLLKEKLERKPKEAIMSDSISNAAFERDLQGENLEEQPSTSKQGAQVQLPMPLTNVVDLLKELKEAGVKKFNIGGVIVGEF